ncbi:YobI family P-loop NTPase [Pasteurella multocida]|uniref:YobI family P-loop NTPase n=1 Tax=Pasteurella multocida TaxID=747 RepID=UPI000E02AF19|nr:P-loop NTPase fold protein [Pasteurella multocida]MDY0502718.1 P-loop NTPase fold protein [Pasteurella multocida]MDY0635231.1 P-loop NTPase fold protein [Pasteurella multocida]MDY0693351.1 P-loop NTPase fold protein [Pasteurella multocida]SUB39344.1 Uncharacterised protein [Pasteurella multocida]HDR0636589.1 hypothetical protein [Pasteurella multocida]
MAKWIEIAERFFEYHENLDEEIYEMNSLAPRNDNNNENQKYYEKKLNSALNDEGIKNIALTGIYGSGKSTILNTFKKNYHEKWSFADISLLTFNIDMNEKENSDKKELSELELQLIERSILQQLFYSVEYDIIPNSRFKRIIQSSRRKHFFIFSLVLLFISGYVSYSYNIFNGYIPEKFLDIVECLFILLPSLVFLYHMIGYVINLKEVRFKIQDTEFNIVNEEIKSILNDHLDEIIYFFQQTKKNVVLIEDLDRFNNLTIFIRLRELNRLINSACKQRVVFIYAIKDDMFLDKDRSKFFDYIIPVIPIINPTNAYDFIKTAYKSVVSDLDDLFLRRTCLYFDDMRLLKNILNEYQDYSNILIDLNLDKNQMFAMIVYKNHYPNDFSKLNNNHGYIFDCFNSSKEELVKSSAYEIEEEINSLKNKIDEIKNESIETVNELNIIYSNYLDCEIRKKYSSYKNLIYKGKEIEEHKYNEEIFKNIKDGEVSELEIRSVGYYNDSFHQINFEDIEALSSSEYGYFERLELVRNKESNMLSSLQDKIHSLNDNLSKIKSESLKALLKSFQLSEEIPDMLVFFIKNGYIDENYINYISYFVESSISRLDKEYAMIISARKPAKFDLQIDNPEELLTHYLKSEELLLEGSLNMYMLKHLLSLDDDNKFRFNFLQNMVNGFDSSNNFLAFLFDNDVDFLDHLIPTLATINDSVFLSILDDNTQVTVERYSKIIKHIGDKIENAQNLARYFSQILSKRSDYIEFLSRIFDGDVAKLKYFSSQLNLNFKRLDCTDLECFNLLGEKGFFDCNKEMIESILINNLRLDKDKVVEKLSISPFSTILESEVSYLIDSFNDKTQQYIQLLINSSLKEGEKLDEKESVIIDLINNEDVSSETKGLLLLNINTKIHNLDDVKNDLHSDLFKHNVIYPSWNNVISFFIKEGMDLSENLADFISNNISILLYDRKSYISVISSFGIVDLQEELESNLIQYNGFNDSVYENILSILDFNLDSIPISELDEGKVLTLISCGKLLLTKDNWKNIIEYGDSAVRKGYLNHHIKNILNNDFIENLEEIDLVTIIESEGISQSEKCSFVERNQQRFLQLSDKYYNMVINLFTDVELPEELYELFKESDDSDIIQHLFLTQAQYLDDDELINLLEQMSSPFSELNKDDMSSFEKNDMNKQILDILYERQIIIKVAEKKDIYVTRMRK